MKTINSLTGIAVEAPEPDLHVGFAMSNEPVPGFIRQMRMGITGLLLGSGQSQLFIPTAALWSLAEANDPAFKAPLAGAVTGPRRVGG
jgi:hypothetical protein